MKLFERQFYRSVLASLRADFSQAADIVRVEGPQALLQQLQNMVFTNGIGKAMRDMYTTVGLWAAKREQVNINASIRENKAGFGVDERWLQLLLEYITKVLLTKVIIPISETTKENIRAIITKGVAEGWGVDRMVLELENSDIPLWRSRLIVRTEMVQAVFKGQELAKEESDFEMVEQWIAADDHRTRTSHHHIDGAIIDEGKRFKVERYKKGVVVGYDMMRGPGDPEAHISNLANCRCTKVTIAKRDKNGRLIRKKQEFVRIKENTLIS